jgi:hypothetical protein
MDAILDVVKPIFIANKFCGILSFGINENGIQNTNFNLIYATIMTIIILVLSFMRFSQTYTHRLSDASLFIFAYRLRLLLGMMNVLIVAIGNLVQREKFYKVLKLFHKIDTKVNF